MIREARDQVKDHVCEVYVSEHSSAVGLTLAEMMNSLGIAPSFAVKIRRRGEANSTVDNSAEDVLKASGSRGSLGRASSVSDFVAGIGSILDPEYISSKAQYWFNPSDLPDRIHYHATEKEDDVEGGVGAASANLHKAAGFHDIVAPSYNEPILAHDVVFIASAEDAVRKFMKSILGESRGLYVLTSNVLALPGFGTELVEVVVSDSNPLIGKRVADLSVAFAEKYRAGLITVRPKNFGYDHLAADDEGSSEEKGKENGNKGGFKVVSTTDGNIELQNVTVAQPAIATKSDQETQDLKDYNASVEKNRAFYKDTVISEHILSYGDTILCVTSEKDIADLKVNRDFFVVSSVGELPKPLEFYTMIPVLVFIAMLLLVATECIEMCPAALTVTAFFFMGKWILPEDIPKLVDIRLLMLMGTSLSFARAMTKSGLALEIASGINNADPSNFGALLLIYAITLVITELISNNAAAALMYPISVALADELGVSYKTFAMAVLVASTAGFMSPIGYQTHVMVWGPGGYNFRDFVIFGFVPDIIYWILGCAVIVAVYPFDG